MKLEQAPTPSPEEQAYIEEDRTLSDAELIKEGAKYKINEKGEKRLELTAEQIDKIKDTNKLTPENVDEKYRKGEKIRVNVKRTSGKMEEDWIVTRIKDGEATVIKYEKNKMLRKIVSLEELKEWNRQYD